MRQLSQLTDSAVSLVLSPLAAGAARRQRSKTTASSYTIMYEEGLVSELRYTRIMFRRCPAALGMRKVCPSTELHQGYINKWDVETLHIEASSWEHVLSDLVTRRRNGILEGSRCRNRLDGIMSRMWSHGQKHGATGFVRIRKRKAVVGLRVSPSKHW
ncbi:hypothetical protein RRG08_058757 [Elysia crispata]|uniref:Uncharacterized protein n=1 Tax=Elysia crispata TaxID=231223 RepID=A0AAE0YYB6_9GAST|nr:hypothetical protein RRG08_058757 [Elysia crispata]